MPEGSATSHDLQSPSRDDIGPLVQLKEPLSSPKSRINRVQANVKDDKPKGKQRAGAGSRSTGKLSKFLTMPLDVIFEVVRQLKPADLLRLSRVSKDFRRTFGSRSSRSLWVAVRKNANEIPDPPPHVSELKFASVLFELQCCACGAGRSQKVCYALMRRLCGACWKLNVKEGSSLLRQDRTLNAEMLPLLTVVGGSAWISEGLSRSPKNDQTDSYYIPELKAVVERYNALSQKDQTTFDQARKKFVAERYTDANAVHQWRRRIEEEKEDTSVTRQEAIENQLIEIGYTEDDFPKYRDQKWTSLLDQPRPLTARIWKNIQPQLVAIIEEHKARSQAKANKALCDRRVNELWPRYQNYLATVPTSEGPLPSCEMLSLTEPLKSVLEREDNGLPLPTADVDAAIPEATRQYSAEARSTLLETLHRYRRAPNRPLTTNTASDSEAAHEDTQSPNENADDELHWASSFFMCPYCSHYTDGPLQAQTYTAIVQHIRAAHLQSEFWYWRTWDVEPPYYAMDPPPLEYTTEAGFPSVDLRAMRTAVEALMLVDLPVNASMKEANGRLAQMCERMKVETVPASFAQLIQQAVSTLIQQAISALV